MSKVKDKAMKLFSTQPTEFVESFEEKEIDRSRRFREEFITAPLTKEEDAEIQLLLENGYKVDEIADEQVTANYENLVDITTQIRAIERQNVLLHGERIRKAREILKPYKDGTFTRWLILAYGNRQTPYRFLQYYEFFQTLAGELRPLIEAMPKKAAYALSSREGAHEKKVELIKEYHSSSANEIICLIDETFPIDQKDKRKQKHRFLEEVDLAMIRGSVNSLLKRKNRLGLSFSVVMQIKELRDLMDKLLTE